MGLFTGLQMGVLSTVQVGMKKWHEAFAIDMANKPTEWQIQVHGTTSCKCFHTCQACVILKLMIPGNFRYIFNIWNYQITKFETF